MKDPNCPNCGGRTFSPIDPDPDFPLICGLCERPDAKFIEWYISHPRRRKAYEAWQDDGA
jgi:hypothetical protein